MHSLPITSRSKLKRRVEIHWRHCECPAGRDPHGTCKHIVAVFIMMKKFTESATLRVAKTATDNLMMFNKLKTVYSGKSFSPFLD